MSINSFKTNKTIMKKFTYLLIVMLGLTFTRAYAQLPPNSIAPDWTLSDINGNSHHLYAYLDSGYTVFMDVSAAWCGPCWSYHTSGELEDLYNTYGPSGTNEVRVFYIEGESTNTTAQLYGTSSGTSHATYSQGDWVTGTPYPIIDNSSLNGPYNIGYFPTIYRICPERLVVEIGQQTTEDLYASISECAGPATASNDPSMVEYTGDNLSLCGDANVSCVIQNHGTTTLSSATVKVYQGATEIGSNNWTGSLTTYQTAAVSFGMLSFTPGAGAITVKITSTDDVTSNNEISATLSIVGSNSLDFAEGFENAEFGAPTEKAYIFDNDFPIYFINKNDFSTPLSYEIGAYGNSTKSAAFPCFNAGSGDVASLVFDRLPINAVLNGDDTLYATFDYAYAQYSTENDRLQIDYSTDCGATWTNVFDKAGSTLMTAPATTSFFVPTTSQWMSARVDLPVSLAGSMVHFRAKVTSAYGNNIYFDNFEVKERFMTGIEDPSKLNNITIYPIPANDFVTVELSNALNNASYELVDMQGKVVASSVIKDVKFNINMSQLSSGAYTLTIKDNEGVVSNNQIVK